jgi:hypothetical protein
LSWALSLLLAAWLLALSLSSTAAISFLARSNARSLSSTAIRGQHFFSTHSVFGQHSLAQSPLSAFLQQQLIAQKATAAINKIFFIRLKSFLKF